MWQDFGQGDKPGIFLMSHDFCCLFGIMKMKGFILSSFSHIFYLCQIQFLVHVLSRLHFGLEGKENWAVKALQSSQHPWVKFNFDITLLAGLQQESVCAGGARMEVAGIWKSIEKIAKVVQKSLQQQLQKLTNKCKRTEPEQIIHGACT